MKGTDCLSDLLGNLERMKPKLLISVAALYEDTRTAWKHKFGFSCAGAGAVTDVGPRGRRNTKPDMAAHSDAL